MPAAQASRINIITESSASITVSANFKPQFCVPNSNACRNKPRCARKTCCILKATCTIPPASVFLNLSQELPQQAPYGYVLKYFQHQAKDIPRAEFVAALQTEGIPCDGLFYEPVYKSSLFPLDPADFPALSWGREKPLDLRNMYSCPEADRAAYHEAVWFPHQTVPRHHSRCGRHCCGNTQGFIEYRRAARPRSQSNS